MVWSQFVFGFSIWKKRQLGILLLPATRPGHQWFQRNARSNRPNSLRGLWKELSQSRSLLCVVQRKTNLSILFSRELNQFDYKYIFPFQSTVCFINLLINFPQCNLSKTIRVNDFITLERLSMKFPSKVLNLQTASECNMTRLFAFVI